MEAKSQQSTIKKQKKAERGWEKCDGNRWWTTVMPRMRCDCDGDGNHGDGDGNHDGNGLHNGLCLLVVAISITTLSRGYGHIPSTLYQLNSRTYTRSDFGNDVICWCPTVVAVICPHRAYSPSRLDLHHHYSPVIGSTAP